MKPFRYSLQAVQTLRRQQEQSALQDHARTVRAAELAAEKLAAVTRELDAVWTEIQRRFGQTATADDLARLQAYAHTVEKRRTESERALQLARHRVRESFAKLVAARQAAAVLDKHFEKCKRLHQHEQRRHEQKLLDDLAARRNLVRPAPIAKPDSGWS